MQGGGDGDTGVGTTEFGNWVSRRLVYGFGMISLFLLVLSLFSWWIALAAIPFVVLLVYFIYARYEFSASGGNIQPKVWNLVNERLKWQGEGEALDIGCGNGAMVIQLAKDHPRARIHGIDYWGGGWGYSKEACERNASIEKVADRTAFERASASALPFDRERFDAVISNFVFHEVRDAKDKRDVVKEALRVLKGGGGFAFQDLFLDKRLYGEIDDLLKLIRTWGISEVEFAVTKNEDFIPRLLKPKFMMGAMGIIYGVK